MLFAHAAGRVFPGRDGGQTADVLDHFGASTIAADRVVCGVQPFEHVFLVGVQPPVAHGVLMPFPDAQISELNDGVVQRVELVRQRGQVDSLIQFLDTFDDLVHVHGRMTPIVPVEQPRGDTARADTSRHTCQRGDDFHT